jgi:hypothetical protein
MRGTISRRRSVLPLLLLALQTLGCARDETPADTSASIVETESTINPTEAQRTQTELVVLRDAVKSYRTQFGAQPTQLRDLEKLGEETFSHRSFNVWSRDGWGRDYRLLAQGSDVMVVSAGPDGEYGTADDLR